jgi:hypothetical protein
MPGFALSRKKTPSSDHARLIQDVRIASPCPAEWSKMRGNDRVRHCAECRLSVYNFSVMTEAEVEESLASRQGGRLCARVYRRADGTMLTQDCPRGFRAAVHRVSRVAGAALAAVMSLNFAWAQTGQKLPQCQEKKHESGLALSFVDPDGALVPKAEITLIQKDGKKKRRGTSDNSGQWHSVGLKAADYLLTARAKGFRPVITEVTLKEGKVLEVQVKLRLEEVTQLVVVGETVVLAGMIEGTTTNRAVPVVDGTGSGRSPQPLKQ